MYGADSVMAYMDTTVCIIVFVSCSNVFTDVWDNVDIIIHYYIFMSAVILIAVVKSIDYLVQEELI